MADLVLIGTAKARPFRNVWMLEASVGWESANIGNDSWEADRLEHQTQNALGGRTDDPEFANPRLLGEPKSGLKIVPPT